MSLPQPTPVKTVVKDDRIIKTHPSYVMTGLSRVTGGGKLFGSEVDNHTFIRLTVAEAEEQWHLSQKWHYGTKRLIEVDLSPAQFAELLTSMNVGNGVTSTLRFIKGDGHIPTAIDEDTLPEQIKTDIKRESKAVIDAAHQFRVKVEAITNASKLTKAQKEELLAVAAKLEMTLSSNMPFVIEQYHEAMDKVAVGAKAEVDAFIQHAVARLGMKSLQEAVKALGNGETS